MNKILIIMLVFAMNSISNEIWKGNEFFISAPPFYQEILEISEINIVINHEPNTRCVLKHRNGDNYSFSSGNKYQTKYNIPINEFVENGTEYGKTNIIKHYWSNSFHLQTDKEVTVWVNIKIGDKEENYNLLPRNNLSKKVKVVTNDAIVFDDVIYPDFFQVTASEDNTNIEVNFSNYENKNIKVEFENENRIIKPNEKLEIYLAKRGDYFGFSNFYANQSLTGTIIKADKPISVISGNWDHIESSSNMLVESLPSIEYSGNNFHLIPFSEEEYKVKIISYEPETEVKIDDEETFILDGSSLIQDESSYEFNVSSNKTITSNKPIMVIQYPKSPSVSMVAMNPIEKYSESFTSLSNGKTKYLVAPINENSEIIENVSIKKEIVDGNEIELEFVSEFEEVNSENLKYKKYGLFKINQNENFEITGESISLYVGDENGIFAEQAYTKLEQITSSVKSQNQFPLFPNPANNEIYISDYVGNAKIINALGIEVWNGNVDNSHKIDISNLPIGYYQLILDNNTSKFIKY